MSLIKYLLSKEIRASKSQLEKDFGSFPPAPLNCTLKQQFCIVRTRGIGRLYLIVALFAKLLASAKLEDVPEPLRAIWNELFMAKIQFREQVDNLVAQIRSQTKGGQILFALIIAPLICLIAPLVIVLLLVKFFTLSIRLYRKVPDGIGYFVPLFNDESNIFLQGDFKNIEFENMVVSHEHIHFLQHSNGGSSSKESQCSEVLFENEWKTDSYLLYLCEKNETEARLHEIVLSYYKVQRKLPLTVEGFLALLAGSNRFGLLVIETLENNLAKNMDEVIEYDGRTSAVAEEIELILLAIKNRELRRRFITEVLTTMYGNLIRYYGDELSSHTLLSKIQRPNLYDNLYPEHFCERPQKEFAAFLKG